MTDNLEARNLLAGSALLLALVLLGWLIVGIL